MESYKSMAKECFTPIINKYELQFAAYNNNEFFLIGKGFALWIFVNLRDRRADTWYVNIDGDGNMLTYTFMYISKERFTQEDRLIYGNPTTFDGFIDADMRVDASGLLNHCQDILIGDKTWLHKYQSKGHYSRHVAKFLAPYFRAQGYSVILNEEV